MTPRQRPRPAPYLNRGDQYRMLAMVGLLCLVMAAIKLAARPQSWYWILPPTEQGEQHAVSLEELDFRVKQEATAPLPPGVFRAVAAGDGLSDDAAGTDESEAVPSESQTLDVAADVLEAIEDNTVGVRRSEVDAYHLMLGQIRRAPDELIDATVSDDVAFTVIMLQSEDYRGRIVGVTGQLRRLTEYPVMENDRGIDRLYEGWVFTNDSGDNPWRFLCTELPPEAVLGEDVPPVKIRFAGYFFKRAGYLSHGGQHVAPTLLAKSFQIVPPPASTTPQPTTGFRLGVLLGVGALIVGVLLALIWWYRSDRAFDEGRLGAVAASRLDADGDDLEALKQWETVDPSQLFESGSAGDGNADSGRS